MVFGEEESVPADVAAGAPASVSFTVEEFARLRSCTWIFFGENQPLVMMHNHEFLRDTPQTCAKRLVETINATTGGSLLAEANGARVTVRASSTVEGDRLVAQVIEGAQVNPAQGVLVPDVDVASEGASADGAAEGEKSGM